MLLTKTFAPETFATALASWSWLGLDGKAPVLASLFGDVFLRDARSWWFLDSMEGTLERVADTRDEMQATLGSQRGQERYLRRSMARAAHERGIELGPDEVYDFSHPPFLGGELDAGNLSAMDFAVSLNVSGQLHAQVRDLPPGTRIRIEHRGC